MNAEALSDVKSFFSRMSSEANGDVPIGRLGMRPAHSAATIGGGNQSSKQAVHNVTADLFRAAFVEVKVGGTAHVLLLGSVLQANGGDYLQT